MKLLAIETCTEACSAALWVDGQVTELYRYAPREHADLILPMADQLLTEAGLSVGSLDGVAFGRGPGSFTGVRIGTGVAQGIAFAADLPLVPVSTLEALALEAHREFACERVACAIDARMGEVYWAAYRINAGQAPIAVHEERVCPPQAVPALGDEGWLGIGSGWQNYGELLTTHQAGAVLRSVGERFPRAGEVVRLAAAVLASAGGVSAEQGLPVYLRDNVAVKSADRKGA